MPIDENISTTPPDSDTEESTPAGSIIARHPSATILPIFAAPSLAGRGKNTIRMELIPIACVRLAGGCFAFGSSFLLPESRGEFHSLSRLRRANPGAPLSVFGHADPVGNDEANKQLSGHRAESVYAVLLHDPARWEKLYNNAGQAEGWGAGAIQRILQVLGFEPGPVTGSMNPATRSAVEAFQSRHKLHVDGIAGPRTREKLFAAYMQFLNPEKAAPADFLGAGRDPKGKAGVQACGEFNPVMSFGKAELEELQKPENRDQRDAENAVNRRVLVLLFRPGTIIAPEKWPCPLTSEGTAACRKRFWSDGDSRRAAKDARRTFGKSRDTFACRFYQRLVNDSPCELRDPSDILRKGRMTISFLLASAGQVSSSFPKYTLRSTVGSYELARTPKNDLVPADQYLQLRFENLLAGKSYTLVRQESDSILDTVFEDVPFEAIVDQDRDDATESLTGHAYALDGIDLTDPFTFDWTS